jgi:hypothetical protein
VRHLGAYRFGFLLALTLGGLGCAPAPKPAENPVQAQDEAKASRLLARARELHDSERYRQIISRFGDTQAADQARQELAVILVEQAKTALAKREWSTANDHAEEARVYANLQTTRQAIDVERQIDEGYAAEVAEAATQLAAQGKCASALHTVAVPLRKKPRAHFKEVVQAKSQKPLVDCLAEKLEQEVKADDLAPARAMIETPDATTALSEAGYKQAHAVLQKLMVTRSTRGIQPLLAQQKWQAAIDKLRQMRQAGTLTGGEYRVALGIVQDAIHASLLGIAKKGLDAPKPSKVMEDIDAQAKIADFKTLPDDLAAARELLAIAVQCETLHCRQQKPEAEWAWGKIDVHPPDDAGGAVRSKLHHAQEVWVVAKGRKRDLIALADPGAAKGAALYGQVAGWIDPAHLKDVDTAMWLPPTDQLAGVRVWGPLRPPNKDYYLGIVKRVDGNKVVVTRLADELDVTVGLKSLRVGKLLKGLRVMAFCTDQLQPKPARVDGVVTSEGGMPKVKYTCNQGNLTRVDLGGSLISKAAWLPPRKP